MPFDTPAGHPTLPAYKLAHPTEPPTRFLFDTRPICCSLLYINLTDNRTIPPHYPQAPTRIYPHALPPGWMGLIDEITADARRRGFHGAMDIIPKLCIAMGGHVLNLRHRGFEVGKGTAVDKGLEPIYGGSEKDDLRCNLFMVGVPGSGKSLIGDLMFGERVGYFYGAVPHKRLGKINDTYLIGGKDTVPGGGFTWSPGLLEKEPTTIYYHEEFGRMFNEAKRSHNVGLFDTMLTAFDSGHAHVGLSGIDHEMRTQASIIACSQPGRFDTKAGLDRRFIFQYLESGNEKAWKRSALRYRQSTMQVGDIDSLRAKIRDRLEMVNRIEEVVIGDDLADWIVENEDVGRANFDAVLKGMIAHWLLDAPSIEKSFVIPFDNVLANFVADACLNRSKATIDHRVIDLVASNTQGLSHLAKRLREERIAPSIPAAREMVESAVRACPGQRLVRVSKGVGRPMDIPTGLEVGDILRAHGLERHQFRGEYTVDGAPIVSDEYE